MANLITVTDESFQTEVIESDLPVMLDNWAPWCGPCRQVAPILEKLAGEYEGKMKFASLNVDENVKVPSHFKVTGIPTILIFKKGEVVETIVGARPEAALRRSFDDVLAA